VTILFVIGVGVIFTYAAPEGKRLSAWTGVVGVGVEVGLGVGVGLHSPGSVTGVHSPRRHFCL
jgi:hypothetical protein